MARIHQIKGVDMDNGIWGMCVSVWFNGCEHACKGCWNVETWRVDDSLYINNDEVVNTLISLLDEHFPKELSLLGGDPLAKANVSDTEYILSEIKRKRPKTKVACWTGYVFEELTADSVYDNVLLNIDVLIDGKFEYTKFIKGRFCGSSNQRIIDVNRTLDEGRVVEYTTDK